METQLQQIQSYNPDYCQQIQNKSKTMPFIGWTHSSVKGEWFKNGGWRRVSFVRDRALLWIARCVFDHVRHHKLTQSNESLALPLLQVALVLFDPPSSHAAASPMTFLTLSKQKMRFPHVESMPSMLPVLDDDSSGDERITNNVLCGGRLRWYHPLQVLGHDEE
jgi:hypothetical protein